jgi:hypothetical protein
MVGAGLTPRPPSRQEGVYKAMGSSLLRVLRGFVWEISRQRMCCGEEFDSHEATKATKRKVLPKSRLCFYWRRYPIDQWQFPGLHHPRNHQANLGW